MVGGSRARGRPRRAGFALLAELTTAVAILAVALTSFASAWWHERRLLRSLYYRAVAMEIVDGELEALAAGEWRAFGEGRHELRPRAEAARSLPDGRLVLTVTRERLRLEWLPAQPRGGGAVVRETAIP